MAKKKQGPPADGVPRTPFTEDELLRIFKRARYAADHEPAPLLADALRHLGYAATAVWRETKRKAGPA